LGPTFLEALKDGLGLKLVLQTGPVNVPVIGHIEEPSGYANVAFLSIRGLIIESSRRRLERIPFVGS
jgi:hypothetical protein